MWIPALIVLITTSLFLVFDFMRSVVGLLKLTLVSYYAAS